MKLNVQNKQTCENLEISSGFNFVLNKYPLFMYTSMRAYLLNRFSPVRLFATPADCSLPWDSSGKNTGVDSHALLHRIFLIQGSNPGLLHCRQILNRLSH